eukprot:1049575-Prorocentrum_minimum.AAC.3
MNALTLEVHVEEVAAEALDRVVEGEHVNTLAVLDIGALVSGGKHAFKIRSKRIICTRANKTVEEKRCGSCFQLSSTGDAHAAPSTLRSLRYPFKRKPRKYKYTCKNNKLLHRLLTKATL